MNAGTRPNVGKPLRVFAGNYYELRAMYPKAFAIRPTRNGYEAFITIEEGAKNVRN